MKPRKLTDKSKLKKDIKLLEKSIRLWTKHNLNQRNVEGMRIYADSCPLCREYAEGPEHVDVFCCEGCPMVLEGYDCGEENSPWMRVYKLVEKWKKTGRKPKKLNEAVEQMIWDLKCMKWDYEGELKGKVKIDWKRVARNIEEGRKEKVDL